MDSTPNGDEPVYQYHCLASGTIQNFPKSLDDEELTAFAKLLTLKHENLRASVTKL